MNKARRKVLDEIVSTLEHELERLTTLRDDEVEAFDARPEAFRDSDAGQEAEAVADAVENAVEQLTDCISSIHEALI